MISALDSGSSGPCSSPDWGHCVDIYCHSVFLHPSVQIGTGEFNAGGINFAMD